VAVTVGALPQDNRFCFIYRAMFLIVIPDASFNQPIYPFIAWGSTLAHPLPFGQGEPLFFRASTVMAAYYRAEYGCAKGAKKPFTTALGGSTLYRRVREHE
jgi:hypothetical protein